MELVKFCMPNAYYYDCYTYELAPSSDQNLRFQVDIQNQHTRKPQFEKFWNFKNSPALMVISKSEYTKNSQSVSLIHYGSIIFFAGPAQSRVWKIEKIAFESENMYIVYNWIKQLNLTLFQVWPLITFYDLIWPQIILNFSPPQNSESKHMYIWFISTKWPDLISIGRVWPLMTLIDLDRYQIWILEKILRRNICLLHKFRLIRPIWPWFDNLTEVWPLVTFHRSWYTQIRNK